MLFLTAYRQFMMLDERLRFLVVGGYNTAVGYAIFALLYFLFPQAHYLILLTVMYAIGILNSVMMLRLFVFKSTRTWFQDILRCTVTYVTVLVANAALLFLIVDIMHVHTLLAQIISVVFIALSSYFGHRFFSFRQ